MSKSVTTFIAVAKGSALPRSSIVYLHGCYLEKTTETQAIYPEQTTTASVEEVI